MTSNQTSHLTKTQLMTETHVLILFCFFLFFWYCSLMFTVSAPGGLTARWTCSPVGVSSFCQLTANTTTQTAPGESCVCQLSWMIQLSRRWTPWTTTWTKFFLMALLLCVPLQPSRPGYPSPRSSEGFFPGSQHPGHYQVRRQMPLFSLGFRMETFTVITMQ